MMTFGPNHKVPNVQLAYTWKAEDEPGTVAL
jgi:hypothetical protein